MKTYHPKIKTLQIFTLITVAVAPAHAATLMVDIGRTGSALLQSGWQEWNTDGNAFNTTGESKGFAYAATTGGTLNASLNTTTTAGARNYGISGVSDPGNLSVSNVWADLFFFNNNTAGTLTLNLSNLKAGTYEISTYHFANVLDGSAGTNDFGIADISVNGVDTGLNATMVGAGFNNNDPKTAAEVMASIRTFQFTVANDDDTVNTTDGPVHDVLVAEQLHCNLNNTPGSAFGRVPTAVNPATLVKEIKSYGDTMFAASEYVKDGLIPIVEVMGKNNPWFDRMQGIIDDMWANAQVNTTYGLVPTSGTEADGEQLQTLARLYTMTGDTKYLDWGERLADRYLLPGTFVPSSLRDHGSEIIGGLGLFYAVESVHRPAKAATYLAGFQFMLDEVLENGTNADGLMYNSLGGGGLSDSWGYNYVSYLCHDMIVSPPRYSLGLQQTLRNLAKPLYTNYPWEGSSIDGYADSIEGGLYQLNRLPVPEGLAWADQEMATNVTRTQNPDIYTTSLWGTYKLESNGVRTVIQHAMMHTRGLIARPWELDLELGASQTEHGVVVTMTSASGWAGILQVDKPRHRLEMGFTKDWHRMNTMPEWFTAEPSQNYIVGDLNTGETTTYTGAELNTGLPVTLDPGVEKLLWIRK